MPVVHARKPLLHRLPLLLFLGVAGCATSPVEGPRLPATAATDAGLSSADGSVTRLVRMGRRSLAAGDSSTALGLLEQALTQDPGNRAAALALGYAHLAVDAPQDAGSAFGLILRRDPDDREAGIGYAKAMIAIGRSEAALEHLQPIIRQRRDDVEAMNLAGVAFDLQGEHAKAEEIYRQGLAVAADSTELKSNLGLSLALAGRHEAALEILLALAEGYVSSPRNRKNLALAYGLAGRFEEAERWSRMDLGTADVENNLRYFRLIGGLAPGAVRSAALQPTFVEPIARPAEPAPRLAAEPEPEPEREPAATPSPAARLPTPLRPQPGFATSDPAVTGLGFEVASLGSWFVDFGPLGEANWRSIRADHPEATAELYRLAAGRDASAPLIVGPFDSAVAADRFCATLGDAVESCTAVRL